jgi:MazG family protein
MHNIQRLVDIMAALRDPQTGCPWDLKQTYRSIVPYTVEEVYEVADAIDRGELDDLREELGDLLFQVVFYARIGEEQGRFDLDKIAEGIADKMVRRHPHVFAGVDRRCDEELHTAWERQKHRERDAKRNSRAPAADVPGEPSSSSHMDGVAKALPALIRAEKLQKRAARVGFDWPEVSGAMEKTREELEEVEQALEIGDRTRIAEELGDLLFALVNVTRKLGIDAEQSLRSANRKFEDRFRAMERRLWKSHGVPLEQLDLKTQDAAWSAIKRDEKRSDGAKCSAD